MTRITITRFRKYLARVCKEPMTLETQSNAGKRARGFFRSGVDHLIDEKGLPIKFEAWNMIRRTYSDRVKPFSNQGMPELSFQSVKVIREIIPIKAWAPAKKGTNEEFSGIIERDFPELSNLTDEQIDRVVSSLRRRELDE